MREELQEESHKYKLFSLNLSGESVEFNHVSPFTLGFLEKGVLLLK